MNPDHQARILSHCRPGPFGEVTAAIRGDGARMLHVYQRGGGFYLLVIRDGLLFSGGFFA